MAKHSPFDKTKKNKSKNKKKIKMKINGIDNLVNQRPLELVAKRK